MNNNFQKMTKEEDANTYGGSFLAVLAAIPAVTLAITSVVNLFRSFTSTKSEGTLKTKEFEYKWDQEQANHNSGSNSKSASKGDSIPVYFGY
ncbi:hypothetical protein EI74_0398 [Mycoplasma testudineum]|uniref:Uncharacterized protein n=1 Tax=Mycoplasma testudineum TaxID=244584 RepID=A0A4R6IEU5_9MOLU|nr:hypothetical protein [Mycoplasma testudineum]OYD27014.1 hypothetical protein CG473_01615 [Mycoplasma testudineum]TDO20562.1 hypothetical protein EI74_0398 [Mycoplasma testudineum]